MTPLSPSLPIMKASANSRPVCEEDLYRTRVFRLLFSLVPVIMLASTMNSLVSNQLAQPSDFVNTSYIVVLNQDPKYSYKE